MCSISRLPDDDYRKRSVQEMRRVIAKTKELARRFAVEGPVGIISNVGGFSSARFLTPDERAEREAYLRSSFLELADLEVELWPQTMPPYPWHFGGQRFIICSCRVKLSGATACSWARGYASTLRILSLHALKTVGRSMSSWRRLRLSLRTFTLPTQEALTARACRSGRARPTLATYFAY